MLLISLALHTNINVGFHW